MASISDEVDSQPAPAHRGSVWHLQQHDSATTLDFSGNMEVSKGESAGLDIRKLDQQTLREFGLAAKRAGSGFASRETSPERGSIASYRVTSRPGTAHTYSAAEVKKHYAGKRRKLEVCHAHSWHADVFDAVQPGHALLPSVAQRDLALRQEMSWLSCQRYCVIMQRCACRPAMQLS